MKLKNPFRRISCRPSGTTEDPNSSKTTEDMSVNDTTWDEDTRILCNNRACSTSNESLRNPDGNHYGSTANGEGYEELFKDSVPCPSCRGLGRVPKELENQLVALIPMKDGRLKPRRTILYVVIAVTICIITASLLIFFLMPRNITISSNRPFLQPTYIDINLKKRFANFTVKNHYNVSNNNFYPVKISGVSMKALYSDAIVAKSDVYTEETVEISARTQMDLPVPIDFVLSGKYGSLVNHCLSNWSWIHNLPILFEVTASYSYMGHSEQASLTTFQTVSCHPKPPKPKPKTTTTPKVVTTTVSTTPKPLVPSG